MHRSHHFTVIKNCTTLCAACYDVGNFLMHAKRKAA